eukprot:1380071-Pyramimonas_sp.AAC.1
MPRGVRAEACTVYAGWPVATFHLLKADLPFPVVIIGLDVLAWLSSTELTGWLAMQYRLPWQCWLNGTRGVCVRVLRRRDA